MLARPADAAPPGAKPPLIHIAGLEKTYAGGSVHALSRIALDIDVSAVAEGAAPAVAGIRLGWEQLLDALAALVSRR